MGALSRASHAGIARCPQRRRRLPAPRGTGPCHRGGRRWQSWHRPAAPALAAYRGPPSSGAPADPQPAVLARTGPWLRAEGRTNSAEFGTSIVLVAQSMIHSPDEIRVAIARHRPARGVHLRLSPFVRSRYHLGNIRSTRWKPRLVTLA
jgi:hypothetical protein